MNRRRHWPATLIMAAALCSSRGPLVLLFFKPWSSFDFGWSISLSSGQMAAHSEPGSFFSPLLTSASWHVVPNVKKKTCLSHIGDRKVGLSALCTTGHNAFCTSDFVTEWFETDMALRFCWGSCSFRFKYVIQTLCDWRAVIRQWY